MRQFISTIAATTVARRVLTRSVFVPARFFSLCLAAVFGVTFSASAVPMFQSLGDLAGGNFSSAAYGISADGSVVVGQSSSASGLEAFRWTLDGGMVGLGDLPGGTFTSKARGTSADGSAVVGIRPNATAYVAWRNEGRY